VDARRLRRLFNQVISREERRRNPKARKLEKTIESIQADREILLHEIKGLRTAIFYEKRKRKRQGSLKNYLLNPEDTEQGTSIIFSPAKIQRVRERKAEIEAQEQEEETRKQREKAKRKLRKE
jgi:cell division protein FtsB